MKRLLAVGCLAAVSGLFASCIPAIHEFTVRPRIVCPGDAPVRLAWRVEGANRVGLASAPGGSAPVAATDAASRTVGENTVFTLAATNDNGTAREERRVGLARGLQPLTTTVVVPCGTPSVLYPFGVTGDDVTSRLVVAAVSVQSSVGLVTLRHLDRSDSFLAGSSAAFNGTPLIGDWLAVVDVSGLNPCPDVDDPAPPLPPVIIVVDAVCP
jgi:hypothetical protein